MTSCCFRRSASAIFSLTVACLLSISTPLFAQGDAAASFGELLAKGQEQLDQEEFDAALQTYGQAVEMAKNALEPRGYIGRAKAHIGLKEYQEALKDFKSAEDQLVGDTNVDLLYTRGKMYLELGEQFYGVALSDLQAVYEEDRSNSDSLFSLGKVYSLLSASTPGAAKEAKELLTTYLETNPDHAEALRHRGKALAALQDYDAALADLNRSIELDPEEHESYAVLGVMFLQQEKYEESVAALDRAIAHYTPQEEDDDLPYTAGYLTKALAFEEFGKKTHDPNKRQMAYEEAVKTCDAFLALLPDRPESQPTEVAALFRKGVNQRLLGQFGQAVKSLTDAIDINPEMGEAYFRRAICFNEMGEEQLALGDLEAAQALNFGDPRAFLWEGLTYAQMEEYRNAIRSYNEAISASNRYVDAYLNRALAYYHLEDYKAAVDSFNECIRLQPTEASHYHMRGISQESLGKTDQAVRSYINAIQLNERYAPAYDLLIPALQAQGRNGLANEYRQKRAGLGG